MPLIDADALEVLSLATCDGQKLHLPKMELERDLYERVNEVIVRLGGKWKKPCHVFAFYDPAPLLAAVVASGEMPPKNPTAFFPTPKPVIDLLFAMVDTYGMIPATAHILEPSAGTGAIVDALRSAEGDRRDLYGDVSAVTYTIDCCEILPVNRAVLQAKGANLVGDDFTAYNPGPVYDAVMMNPPFSLEGDKLAYITHIGHAWSLLKSGGVLGAIVPTGWTFAQNRKANDFLDFVTEYGGWEEVEAGAFKESGTGIPTIVVALSKSDNAWRSKPLHGHMNWYVYEFGLYADNDRGFERERERIAALPHSEQQAAFWKTVEKFADGMKRKHGSAVRIGEAEHAALWAEFSRDWLPEDQPDDKTAETGE